MNVQKLKRYVFALALSAGFVVAPVSRFYPRYRHRIAGTRDETRDRIVGTRDRVGGGTAEMIARGHMVTTANSREATVTDCTEGRRMRAAVGLSIRTTPAILRMAT